MSLRPGSAITEHVRLVRPLGQGGMGSVWVAEHLTLQSEVAVKFISRDHADRQHRRRFEREATLAARIKSPHVVRIFDHGVADDGRPYIVMELLEGESLAERLAAEGRLEPLQIALLVAQVAEALSRAHRLDIVHRDIKPSNLFLVESGYELFTKVLDFGIAKQTQIDATGDVTETGALVGTPLYMSPEMLLSPKSVDHRADLWALAVVAYHALTGEVPFKGETPASLAFAIQEGRLVPPSAVVGDLAPEIDVWFKLALCRDLDLRFPTAQLLSESFGCALRGEPFPSGGRAGGPSEATLPTDDDGNASGKRGTKASASARDAAGELGEADEHERPSAGPASVGTAGSTVTAPVARQSEPAGSARPDRADEDAAAAAPAAAPSTFAGSTSSGAGLGRSGSRRGRWLGLVAAMAALAVVAWLGLGLYRSEATSPAEESRAVASEHADDTEPERLASSTVAAAEDPRAEVPSSSAAATQGRSSLPAAPAPAQTASPGDEPASGAGRPARPSPASGRTTARPGPGLKATSAAGARSPGCEQPFVLDADGDLIPKLECLPQAGQK